MTMSSAIGRVVSRLHVSFTGCPAKIAHGSGIIASSCERQHGFAAAAGSG